MHFRYQPAGPVSGDYLDVVTKNAESQTLYFLLGDVSGKGVAASLTMARLNALVRSTVEASPPLGDLMERTSRLFSEGAPSSQFATLVCARATSTGEVELCNAGHCPPLIVRSGCVEVVDSGGLPIGLAGAVPYGSHRLSFARGDTLLLYSDGITEASDPEGRMYGIDGLRRVVGQNRDVDPAALAAACLLDVATFRAGTPPHDDVSIMVIRRTD